MPVSEVAVVEEWVECDKCGGILEVGRFPFCPHDFTHGHRPFPAYSITHEGRTYLIDSIQAAARVERETAARAQAGEGSQIVLRAFHQDRSNLDKNTLESAGYRQRKLDEVRYDRRGNPMKVRKWRA